MPGDVNDPTFPNNLPPELLAEIFVLTRCSPFILGNVCTIWRAITSSTPALWSRITLRAISPTFEPEKYKNQLSFFKTQLARSGDTPLTLKLMIKVKIGSRRLRRRPWRGTNPIPVEFVRMLADSARRWQSVDFEGIPMAWHSLLDEATKLMPDGFPHLHTLKVVPPPQKLYDTYSDEEDDDEDEYEDETNHSEWGNEDEAGGSLTPWRLNLFSRAPALKTLVLIGCRLVDVDIPWSQLTSLYIRGILRHECLYVLREAPNLEYLEIHPPSFDGSRQPPLDHCYLQPVLKRLILGHRPMEFLRQLSAPKLRTLELVASRDVHVSEWLKLPQLLDGFECQLRQLKLLDIYISSKNTKKINIIHLLREISSLEELEVGMAVGSGPVTDTNLFVELLKMGPGSDTHFLPNLTVFSYAGPIQVDYRLDEPIFHQLRYRHGLAAAERNLRPLSSFYVYAKDGYSPIRGAADRDRSSLLRELSEGGLRFRVIGGKKTVF